MYGLRPGQAGGCRPEYQLYAADLLMNTFYIINVIIFMEWKMGIHYILYMEFILSKGIHYVIHIHYFISESEL
jgi:hypothetical protein